MTLRRACRKPPPRRGKSSRVTRSREDRPDRRHADTPVTASHRAVLSMNDGLRCRSALLSAPLQLGATLSPLRGDRLTHSAELAEPASPTSLLANQSASCAPRCSSPPRQRDLARTSSSVAEDFSSGFGVFSADRAGRASTPQRHVPCCSTSGSVANMSNRSLRSAAATSRAERWRPPSPASLARPIPSPSITRAGRRPAIRVTVNISPPHDDLPGRGCEQRPGHRATPAGRSTIDFLGTGGAHTLDFSSDGRTARTSILDNVVLTTSSRGDPEPATWAMMLLGFGAIGLAMRRRRTTALA